jgi:predicted HicB family RNase H-like nuclease
MKKRMGRPPKPKAERKGKRFELRISTEEYRKLVEKAKAAGMSVAEFVRECAKD